MKILNKLLFICAMTVGLSATVSAQKNDQQKPKPKPSPPVITPAPPKPKDEKPHRPHGEAWMIMARTDERTA